MSMFCPVNYFKEQDEVILLFNDSITAYNAYNIYQFLEPKIKSESIKEIYCDFSHTTYIDSTFIGTLIRLKKILKNIKGNLVLYNIKGKLQKIFKSMHLLNYFKTAVCENATKIEDDMLECIPNNEQLSSKFVLDVHRDIVEAKPELKTQFNNLFKVLHSHINNCKSRG